MTELTTSQRMRLEILRLVMNDTAAAQKAIEFIGDDTLKFELFKDQYKLVQTESGVVARTDKSIRNAQEALSLFK
ncbi:DUF2560 family protein [Xenorhabdus bovienii]|uniref:DUF2560 family protein n=1 Tax=Xenorhabdus bovienii TaxID=40576 RepID=UPI00237C6AE3|nr:DUF2560 family protein [Xenorhabdus bovienii]MDE1487964.1 DUF2560 family protein [Xenorhabdus bovienii]MDE9477746.1 DUF2560 family protein [Xenorhabdus bovienii]MDE9526356.1 DUF2560 family protein [Xenorhabdus bovienii]MDE9530601.1 DUF2560 family protein [Xenorhabdus bovienii]MDE9569784.1 DUF2560 family protein [Xenorhabdus bovienii]